MTHFPNEKHTLKIIADMAMQGGYTPDIDTLYPEEAVVFFENKHYDSAEAQLEEFGKMMNGAPMTALANFKPEIFQQFVTRMLYSFQTGEAREQALEVVSKSESGKTLLKKFEAPVAEPECS